MSINRQTHKEDVIHTHTHTPPLDYHSDIKKRKKFAAARIDLDLEIFILSEQRKTNII